MSREKTRLFCPGTSDLNWTGKGLKTQPTPPWSLTDSSVLFLVEETLSPSTATIVSWFQHHTQKPTSHLICYNVLKKLSLPFPLASSSWLISTLFSFWSLVNKCSTNFVLIWCSWSFSLKIWWQDPMLMPTSSATSRAVKRQFPWITAQAVSTCRRLLMWKVVRAWDLHWLTFCPL